ncbi:aminodeoxychorismate synthase component I [Saprospiraceae bacterium]|nr:aminodeoxychorismate synthase component I [Saprospiraceae bacterium]
MKDIFKKMNEFGESRTPFFFIIDFEMEKPIIHALDDLPCTLQYTFNGAPDNKANLGKKLELERFPFDQKAFSKSFQEVLKEINYGNSFLLNLTFPSKIKMNFSLEEIYAAAAAKYMVLKEDDFVSFSPETFVTIRENSIFSYPMKGTIDASIPGAESIILANKKEEAEHYTIVDLIRNDLARVSTNVEVTKFRYIDEIKTHSKSLLQVSSEIKGDLPDDWHKTLGNIFRDLLPAGSISGAPKKKTLEIIRKNEFDKRGYYTGIAGRYDGNNLDSCVLIRFIEQKDDAFTFRSGGGITYRSDEEEEYQELIQKIYVPVF